MSSRAIIKKVLTGIAVLGTFLFPLISNASILGVATQGDINNLQAQLNVIQQKLGIIQQEASTSRLLGAFNTPTTGGGGGGGGGGVTTSSALTTGTLPIATGAGSLGNSLVTQTASSTNIPLFNYSYYLPTPSMLALNGCMGSSTITDAGGCVNYIYSIAPSSTNLYIPPFYYLYSTPIVINSGDKELNIIGAGGGGLYFPGISTLQYTSSTGVAFTYNVQKFSTAGVGMYNLSLIGPAGPGKNGSSSNPTTATSSITLGMYLGGSTGTDFGATGYTVQGVQISGFGQGAQWGPNTFITNFTGDVINNNGINIYMPGATNAFENDKFTNDLFGNCNSATGASSTNCIFINPNTSGDVIFQGDDFDQSQVVVSSTGIGNVSVRFLGSHFENAGATACYDFITTSPGQVANESVYSSGDIYEFGYFTPGLNCNELVSNGGNFVSSGDSIASYSDNNTSTIKFVNNLDASDTVSWNGLTETWMTNASQTTQVYGSVPISSQGFGLGSANPSLWILGTNVGIGTFTPGQPLEVNGNIKSDGNFTVTGAGTISNIGASLTVNGSSNQLNLLALNGVQTQSKFTVANGITLSNASGTFTTGAIGGGSLTAGTCASTTTALDSSIATSTAAFITTPKVDPGPDMYWETVLIASSSVSTRVCAAGITGTPVSSAYNVKIIQ